jgi:hypothetical protein
LRPRRTPLPLPARLRFRATAADVADLEYGLILGAYISTLEWHHFVTLTVDHGAAGDWLRREFENRFIRRLAFAARRRIDHFVAVERDEPTGRFAHLHALLHGTRHLGLDGIRSLWPHGFTDVAPYDRRRDAAHYVVKGLIFDADCYGWSRCRPPQVVAWDGRVERDVATALAAWRGARP